MLTQLTSILALWLISLNLLATESFLNEELQLTVPLVQDKTSANQPLLWLQFRFVPAQNAELYFILDNQGIYKGSETTSLNTLNPDSSLDLANVIYQTPYANIVLSMQLQLLEQREQKDKRWYKVAHYQILEVIPHTFFHLNDTGITWSADLVSGNHSECTGETALLQDCFVGHDAKLAKASSKNGFNFTKLDENGQILPASAAAWACVKDNITGLVWEVKPTPNNKVANQGLHDADDSYSWRNTDAAQNDDNAGALGAASICYGYDEEKAQSFCNTEAFVNRVNAEGYCGFKDWRLPSREELRSIVDYGRHTPAIDTDYFPDTKSSFYWSATSYAASAQHAWAIDFETGHDNHNLRRSGLFVRLVRGD